MLSVVAAWDLLVSHVSWQLAAMYLCILKTTHSTVLNDQDRQHVTTEFLYPHDEYMLTCQSGPKNRQMSCAVIQEKGTQAKEHCYYYSALHSTDFDCAPSRRSPANNILLVILLR